jgi:hypothetical protein
MISNAIQAKCESIIPNTFVTIGDEKITVPFCTHNEVETPVYLKAGLSGYEYEVEIFIADVLPDNVGTLGNQIITAIGTLEGTTADGTKIDMVEYQGDNPGFDTESRLYGNILKFLIETSNR